MRRWSAALVVLPLLMGGVSGTGSDEAWNVDPVQITEWKVPWEGTRPRDPYVDPWNRVWFCGQSGNYIAMLDPKSGEFKQYEVPPVTHPHNLIIDDEGNVWYAGNRNAHIGRLDPKTGEITKYAMPDGVRDPHTLMFNRDGDVWFTAQQSNVVGKLTVATGEVQVVEMSTPRARPYGIVLDSRDHPWIAVFAADRIATIDPATMTLRDYVLPRPEIRPRRLVVTSDDMVWYVDYATGTLGKLDPGTGNVVEWAAPGGEESRPYAMAVDDRDRVWFFETGPRGSPNRLVGFDTKTLEFFSTTELESGGGTVRHMVYHEPTRSIWFGTDTNTIGRAQIP